VVKIIYLFIACGFLGLFGSVVLFIDARVILARLVKLYARDIFDHYEIEEMDVRKLGKMLILGQLEEKNRDHRVLQGHEDDAHLLEEENDGGSDSETISDDAPKPAKERHEEPDPEADPAKIPLLLPYSSMGSIQEPKKRSIGAKLRHALCCAAVTPYEKLFLLGRFGPVFFVQLCKVILLLQTVYLALFVVQVRQIYEVVEWYGLLLMALLPIIVIWVNLVLVMPSFTIIAHTGDRVYENALKKVQTFMEAPHLYHAKSGSKDLHSSLMLSSHH